MADSGETQHIELPTLPSTEVEIFAGARAQAVLQYIYSLDGLAQQRRLERDAAALERQHPARQQTEIHVGEIMIAVDPLQADLYAVLQSAPYVEEDTLLALVTDQLSGEDKERQAQLHMAMDRLRLIVSKRQTKYIIEYDDVKKIYFIRFHTTPRHIALGQVRRDLWQNRHLLVTEDDESEEQTGDIVFVDEFEQIYTGFQTKIINFLYRLTRNQEVAYDLAQDVFVKAYRALGSKAEISRKGLSAWLYRIASNTAADWGRRRKLIQWLPLSLFNEDRSVGAGLPNEEQGVAFLPDTDREVNLGEADWLKHDGEEFEAEVANRELVERIIARIPDKYAVVLNLQLYHGFSCAEIGEMLDLSPSAVKMRAMRARERFVELYRQEMPEEREKIPA